MKILLLSPLPPPVGGIASWTVNILDYYKDNIDIELIHQNTAIKSRGITRLDPLSRLTSGTKDSFRNIVAFFGYMGKNKPDVIHMTSSGSMGLWRDLSISFLSSVYKVPIVIHFRFGRIPEIHRLNNWEWKVLKRVISFCSATVLLDDKSCEIIKKQGFRDIYTIPNPVSKYVEDFITEDHESTYKEEELKPIIKIIFVGHITKNKGVFELVEACSLLNSIDELLLVGPYEEDVKSSLLNIALIAGINIKFTGVLDKENVLSVMRSASMLVLPSYSEGFPNVIIEAMAMKCPVIATDVGAIASILDIDSLKPAGIVIEPKNIKALSEAINLIITDSSKGAIFIHNAFSKVKQEYTLENICNQYEKVWNIAHQK